MKVAKKIMYEEEPELDSEDELEEQPEEEIQEQNPVKKTFIYNEEEMKEKLEEIQKEVRQNIAKKNIIFSDFMTMVAENGVELTESQINDDIQREVVLYKIALENAKKGLEILEKVFLLEKTAKIINSIKEGIKTQRPDDFLAEMYKKDQVMQKIKNRLVKQQVKIQNFEEKRHRMENKKFAKQLKAKKEQEKHKEKRKNIEAIDKWKEEIKTKGDKAKDLSEFLLKSKDKKPKFNEKNNKFNSQNKEKMSHFSKKVKKMGSSERKSRKKMPKQKRPGKVKRMIMKNKKSSGKRRK